MAKIEDLVPHRPPFLFVDNVEVEGNSIVASHTFRADDWFFKGHFPDYPVVPGVLLIETMAQAGGAGVKLLGIEPDGTFMLAKIRSATFRRQVRPGERLDMKIQCRHATAHIIHQKGTGLVGGSVAVEAEWIAMSSRGAQGQEQGQEQEQEREKAPAQGCERQHEDKRSIGQ